MSKITRVIFNFTSKCNLPCKFCYIPFDNIDNRDIEFWKRIVDKCKEIGAEVITFGGGDPFMYKQFIDLLEYSRDGKTFLQIDTNALALHEKEMTSIVRCANLVGLPLEGSEEDHSRIRGNDKHYAVVRKWLARLLQEQVPVKINTVLTRQNAPSLLELAALLDTYPISKWSIYQFWALSIGRENRSDFELSLSEYDRLIERVRREYPNINLEASNSGLRHKSYFFVSHTGRVYVMKNDNQEEYLDIGDIFDPDIVNKWEFHGSYDALLRRTHLRKAASRQGA